MKYYRYKIENLIKVNKIITIHYFDFKKDFKSQPESHDFWELFYADKNSFYTEVDGKEIKINEGDLFFFKPNSVHRSYGDGVNPIKAFVISFECKSESIHFFEDKKFRLKDHNVKLIYSIIKEMKRTFNIPFSDPNTKKMPLSDTPTLGGLQLIKNYLEILLINVLRDETETDGKNKIFVPSSEKGGLVEKITEILENNLFSRLNMEKISENTNYSKSYIFRTFKKTTGSSVISYFNHLKIDKAKALLKESNLSVNEISDLLKFDTPSYFSKAFKRLTGYSPLQYKKIVLQNKF